MTLTRSIMWNGETETLMRMLSQANEEEDTSKRAYSRPEIAK